MSFDEVQFPTDISRGSAGGPERRTDIVTLRSGFEQRNTIWANSRRRYDASLGLRVINSVYTVLEFFEARSGRLHGFRWKDWSDYKSCAPGDATTNADVLLGAGDDVETDFQLVKKYTSGGQTYTRTIKKPVVGSLKVVVDSVAQTEGVDYAIDTTTGIITFVSPVANTLEVTAGFEFDVPVRFDSDFISISVEAFEVGAVPAIDILEIRV